MLLFQKAVVEGSIHLLLQCSLYEDRYRATGDERAHLLLELLTPIAKSYPAEYGNEAVSTGMQVLGGAGYTDDFPLEQIFRDIRVNSIYEGTTTIHGLDLLGRKVLMENGKAVRYLNEELLTTIKEASVQAQVADLAKQLGKSLEGMQAVMEHLLDLARTESPRVFLADATVFLDYFGLHVIGWCWLRQATVAARALDAGATVGKPPLSEDEQAFYRSKVQTARYFFTYLFPKTAGLHRTLLATDRITLQTPAELIV
jgi:butyryl-CoA dehydrogenase